MLEKIDLKGVDNFKPIEDKINEIIDWINQCGDCLDQQSRIISTLLDALSKPQGGTCFYYDKDSGKAKGCPVNKKKAKQ